MRTSGRINGFDALRTVAMWLGVLLHAIIAYKKEPLVGWPKDPAVNSGFLDWLYLYIHTFRMPLFFLVAGFFSRLVIKRSGVKYFLIQRFNRIFIPFVFGVFLLVPLTMLPFEFHRFHDLLQLPVKESLHNSFLQMFSWNGLSHLWFLYYLIFFYLLAVIVNYLSTKLSFETNLSAPKSATGFTGLLLLFIVVLYGLLTVYKEPFPTLHTGLRPQNFMIFYFGLFYFGGWVIHSSANSLSYLKSKCWELWLIGTFLSVILFLKKDFSTISFSLLLTAFQTIFLVAGLVGLFLKYFHEESKTWRYLSDSAYWVYLVHMGIVAGLQEALQFSPIPGLLRLPITLGLATLLSLVTYEYWVRYTIIGVYLHGKREKVSRPGKIKSATI